MSNIVSRKLLTSSLIHFYNYNKGSVWLNNKVIRCLTFIRHTPVDLKGVFLKVLSFFFHRERCCGKFWLIAGWFQSRVSGRKNVSGSSIWTRKSTPAAKFTISSQQSSIYHYMAEYKVFYVVFFSILDSTEAVTKLTDFYIHIKEGVLPACWSWRPKDPLFILFL